MTIALCTVSGLSLHRNKTAYPNNAKRKVPLPVPTKNMRCIFPQAQLTLRLPQYSWRSFAISTRQAIYSLYVVYTHSESRNVCKCLMVARVHRVFVESASSVYKSGEAFARAHSHARSLLNAIAH